MMTTALRSIAAACGAFFCFSIQAATVVVGEQLPDTTLLAGVQSTSEATLTPAALAGIAGGFTGYRLELIQWWGYDLADPDNAAAPFEVKFNGAVVTGSLSRDAAGALAADANSQPDTRLFLYSLDLDDAVNVSLTGANSLSIWNMAPDSDWYWQTSGSADEADMAFRLAASQPDNNQLPEPASLALVACAGVGLLAGTRRRKTVQNPTH
ncbi:hypothetical protein [Roseateles sp. LKC17W]